MKKRKYFFLFLLGPALGFLFLTRADALLQSNRVILVNDYNELAGPGLGPPDLAALHGREESGASCLPRLVTGEAAFGKGGGSLAVDYNVEAPGSSCSWAVELAPKDPDASGTGVADLSGMGYLSFWVKSQNGNTSRLQLVVEITEDRNGDHRYAAGEDRASQISTSGFSGKVGPDGWKKVVIPFTQFRGVQRWDGILGIRFILENRWRLGKGIFLLDDLLIGSNYPDGLLNREISMQNRVSSFKIGGHPVENSQIRLKHESTVLTLTLVFIDPYLESVRFEESWDGGNEWKPIESFYDQTNGGVYEVSWKPAKALDQNTSVLIRAVGVNLFGGETELAEPTRLTGE